MPVLDAPTRHPLNAISVLTILRLFIPSSTWIFPIFSFSCLAFHIFPFRTSYVLTSFSPFSAFSQVLTRLFSLSLFATNRYFGNNTSSVSLFPLGWFGPFVMILQIPARSSVPTKNNPSLSPA